MDFKALVMAMSPDTYQKLTDAVSTGRWADGTPLNDSQKEQTMQLVMAYQAHVLKSDEIFTIGADGEMVHKSKAMLKKEFTAQSSSIARFSHDDL